MFKVAVNAAIGKKTEDMEGGIIFFAVFHCGTKCFVFEKASVTDCIGDSHKGLINNSSCADVGVANFGVAHLTVRKSDVKSGSTDYGFWAGFFYFIKVWHFCGADCVSVIAFVIAKTIKDH